jgi:phenylalanyl-tRNA synthetase beta chain
MKISYNWLKWYIQGDLPQPEELADILTFKLCEVEGIVPIRADGSVADPVSNGISDWILDLNILPNRAHDLLSHQGVAREVAGILGLKFKDPTDLYKIPKILTRLDLVKTLSVEIKNPACRRYMARIVRNVKVGPSPEWVVKHLESIGQRSINNIVDATNLVMFDCGNPTHAFDLSKINPRSDLKNAQVGPWIIITNAKEGEEFAVVGRDQIVARLKDTDMVIADGQGNTLAIAGVKGGLTSGINDETTDIVLEVANFDPVAVRKTARRLNLLSDSAKRFENDLSPEHAQYAMKELSGLILEMCPEAEFEEIIDIYQNPQQSREISFSIEKINKYLGTTLSENEMVKILTNYGYEISGIGDMRTLAVPVLRLDLTGPHDIAEEVARLYGLDKIIATPFPVEKKTAMNETVAKISAVKKKFIEDDYREVITYAFRKKGVYEVARGVGDKGALRINLSDGLKESYEMNRLNMPLLGMDSTGSPQVPELKIFEIGTVWLAREKVEPLELTRFNLVTRPDDESTEETHVAWVDKKGVTEMTLDEYIDNYKLQITNYQLRNSQSSTKNFTPWSHYPFISRDIAVWVSSTSSEQALKELEDIYKKEGGELLVRPPYIFDIFSKGDKTSIAHRLVFQSFERTLVEEDVTEIISNIYKKLKEDNFEIR